MLPILLLLVLGGAQGQGQGQGQEGILPPWESKVVVDQAQQHTRNLIVALAQLDTGHWKGDYDPLLASTRQRVIAVADALDRLAHKPESLSLAVDAFLSLQHIETNVDSLARGAERFQPTAVQPLDQASSEFVKAREQFQGYLLDLSRYLEKNLAVAAKDLEQCRDQLWRRPPAPPPTARPRRPTPDTRR